MLDHVTIGVSDIELAKRFYDRALRPLGIERLYGDGTTFAGYGADRRAFFWIGLRDDIQTGAHVAFAALDARTLRGTAHGRPAAAPKHPNKRPPTVGC